MQKVISYNKNPSSGLYSITFNVNTGTSDPKYYKITNPPPEPNSDPLTIFPTSSDGLYTFVILPESINPQRYDIFDSQNIISASASAFGSVYWHYRLRYFMSINNIKNKKDFLNWLSSNTKYSQQGTTLDHTTIATPNIAFYQYIWNLTPTNFCINIDPIDNNSKLYGCSTSNINQIQLSLTKLSPIIDQEQSQLNNYIIFFSISGYLYICCIISLIIIIYFVMTSKKSHKR
jgi:hypothetical protein